MFRALFKLASVKEVRDNFLGGIIENQKMILEDEKNKSHAAKPQAK